MPETMPSLQDRYRGCLLRLAVGGALGITPEFKRPDTFMPIDDMTGSDPAVWADDTAMGFCLA